MVDPGTELSPSKYETRTPVVGSSPAGSDGMSIAFSHTVPVARIQFVQSTSPSHCSVGSTTPLPQVCSTTHAPLHPSDASWLESSHSSAPAAMPSPQTVWQEPAPPLGSHIHPGSCW